MMSQTMHVEVEAQAEVNSDYDFDPTGPHAD